MAVKNKKKKKDEKLAKRSWLDAYGSMSEGLGELADQVIDPTNDLQVGLAALRKSGLVGMLAEHLKNRRDLKAAGQVDQIPAINNKAMPGSNQANVDTVFQGAEEANYTGNTNLFGGMPKISTPNVDLGKIASADIPGLSAKNLAASGGDLGKLVTQNPQISAFDLAKAQLPQGATGLSNIPSTGAGATAAAGITPAAALGIASLAVGLLGGNKKQEYTPTTQPQNRMGQGQKGEDIAMPMDMPMPLPSIKDDPKRRPRYNPYV